MAKRTQRRGRQRKRLQRRRQNRGRKLSDNMIRTMIRASRHLLKRKVKTTPANMRKLRRLATCGNCRKGRAFVQRGGILPIIPLLAAAAPFIGKALLGVGASAAASAAGSAIHKAINKTKR